MKRLPLFLFATILFITVSGIATIDHIAPPLKQSQELLSRTIPNGDPQKGVLGGCDDGTRDGGNYTVATQKPADGMYESTGFGCFVDDQGNRNDHDTPGCNAACGPVPGECDGLSNEECMYKVKWFAANSDQYGCFNRVKVTNPANGKAVVLVIYDIGPNCNAQPNGKVFDMSYPATSYLGVGNYEKVKVEEVPKDTPLGIADGSISTNPPGGSSTSGGGIPVNIAPLSLLVRPKKDVKDVYIINKATATAVGGGSGSSSGTGSNPAATGDLAEVLGWAQKINDALEPGYDYETGDTWYDKMVADICNGDSKGDWCASKSPANDRSDLYWCTFTVVDAFNLAHKKGLTYDHLAVIDMVAFWKSTSSYVYINYQSDPKTALQKVVPGTPFFLANDLSQTTEHEHTGIVKTISIDQNGNGSITTLESNSTAKSHTFPIENWDVKNVFFTLQGFGGIN